MVSEKESAVREAVVSKPDGASGDATEPQKLPPVFFRVCGLV